MFATLFLLAILPATQYHSSIITLNQLAPIIIYSVINLVIGDTFYLMALKKIGVSRAQPISSSYPLYSMFLAAAILNEELTFAVAIGTPLIVVGIAIVSLARNNTAPNGTVTRFGVILSIVAAVFLSIGFIILKMTLNNVNIDPIFATFISRLAALPFLLLAVAAAGETDQITKLSMIDVSVLALAGMLALGLGGIFLFSSLALIDASKAVPLSSTSPFFSLILASIYAGEKVGAKIVVGTTLIVTGIILVTI